MNNYMPTSLIIQKMDIPKNIHPTKTKSHEQTESLNRPMTSTAIESLIKNLPTPGRGGFNCKFY